MLRLLIVLALVATPAMAKSRNPKIEAARISLIRMGVCNGCAFDIASDYVLRPKSPCGREAARALHGDIAARNRLTDWFGSVCRPRD